jgi:hypothetical protein
MEFHSQLLQSHPWQAKENPQNYELIRSYAEHPKPSQHMLGLVGGNEVPYQNRFLQVDTESDLRGITRPNTFCPSRQHQPPQTQNVQKIERKNPKENVTIQVVTTPLKQSQMWAYPATLAPEPLLIETCAQPQKY